MKQRNVKKMFSISSSSGSLPYVKAKVNGTDVQFLVDTGSSVSVLSECLASNLGLTDSLIVCENKSAVAANGGGITLTHKAKCELSLRGHRSDCMFYVGNITPEAVPGMDLMSRLPFSLMLAEECIFATATSADLLSEFKDVFDKNLKDSCLRNYEPREVIPIQFDRPYRAPVRQFSRADEKIINEKNQ